MSRPLSNHPKAVAARRRRAKQKLSLVSSTPDLETGQAEADQAPDLEAIAEVEVQAPAPAPAQSFAQRMLSRFNGSQAGEKKKAQKKKKVEINFLTASLPMVTGVLASYAQSLVAEPYKALAPKQNEVTAIIAPIFRIIERRLQIQAELTEDEVDLLASGQALLGYMARATVTYLDIKNSKTVEAQTNAQAQATAAAGDRGGSSRHDGASTDLAAREAALVMQFGRSGQTSLPGADSDPVGQPSGYVDGFQASNDAPEYTGNPGASSETDRSWELATVARAFKRDFNYRTANGLL